MKKHIELFRSKPKKQSINNLNNSAYKEDIEFNIAVMGYTLDSRSNTKHLEATSAFLNLAGIEFTQYNNINDSKKYQDIAAEVDVIIHLLDDDDPLKIYQCGGKANKKSITADACIAFYDPTQKSCIDTLDRYLYHITYERKRIGLETGILCLIGINQDKPEQHQFGKQDIVNCVIEYYDKDCILIHHTDLNPSPTHSKNIAIILKNLAIYCLTQYKKAVDEDCTISQPLLKPELHHPLEIPYYVYTTLLKANNRPEGIYGYSIPVEIRTQIIAFLVALCCKKPEDLKILLNINRSMPMEKLANDERKKPKQKCAMM